MITGFKSHINCESTKKSKSFSLQKQNLALTFPLKLETI